MDHLVFSELKFKAKNILKANCRGAYTVPSAKLYPHQWAWDSAFAAIGWSHIDLNRALLELESLLLAQWSDGRIAHLRFNEAADNHYPDASFWLNDQKNVLSDSKTSTITQPPVWAIAARRLYEMGADTQRIQNLLPAFEKSHIFYKEQRDPLGWNVVAVCHPWESGLDNSPVWDLPLERIDQNYRHEFKRVDIEIVDNASETRPDDLTYQLYAALVKEIAHNEYGMGSFQVYDPMMTGILIKAETDLAWLCKKLGVDSAAEERSAALTEGLLKKLWCKSRGRFIYFDALAQEQLDELVLAAFIPLISNLPFDFHQQLLNSFKENFSASWKLPSVSPASEKYNPQLYWRGPVWPNMNWLFRDVADQDYDIRSGTIRMISENGFWEYYNPQTGKGLGGDHFSWTAAVVLDFLSDLS